MSVITSDMVKEMAATLSRLTASPQFLAMVQHIQDAEDSEKLQVARQLATRDSVTSRGIAVPDDFRFTTRSFESPAEAPAPGTPVSYETPVVSFENGCGMVAYRDLVITVRRVSE
jgi:hypothetical protein